MTQFDRKTAGQRIRKGENTFLSRVFCCAAILALLATPVFAQRVEFPTPAQPVQMTSPYTVAPSPYTVAPNPYAVPATTMPPPTYAAPATSPPTLSSPFPPAPAPSVYSPYPTTSYGAPPAPAYSPAAVGPPPVFDPYSSGSSVAPPPPAVPYTYGAQPPPTYGQPAPLAPNGAPYQYQPPPYDITPNGDGYWAKTQKLLQEISFEYTFLYGKQSNPNDFGLNRAEISSTFAFPMFGNIETPLLVTPGFAANWLQGPLSGPPLPGPPVTAGGPDLPPQVYDAYLDFAWYPHCYEWLGGELGFRPGVYSDFHNVDSDSLRFMGRAAASIATSPNLDIVLGAVYLDRVDVKILPVAGIHYRPTPDWDMYLVFPNPKVRKFLAAVGNTKWYGYAAGEYGGGSWTVARQTEDDRIDYNDIRVIGGLEWETQTQIRGHIEAGYVFDREIVFDSGDPPNFKPNDTIMLRAGVGF